MVVWKYLGLYILILTAGNTVFTATNWKFTQVLFIEYRNYPGGPLAFFSEQFQFWANTVSNSAYVFCNFLVDGLVLYRCWAIWNHNYFVIALPALWFLVTTVLSALTTYQSAKPNSAFNAADVVIAVPYWSLTVAFNIVLTLLIVGRLFHMRAKLRGVLGDQHTRTYTSIAAMIYESAALYSFTGIAFIVAFARNSPALYVILPFLGEVMCIAPLLIILRVALGRSFSSQTNAGVAQGSNSWRAPVVTGGKSSQGTVIGMSSVTHKAYDSSIGSRHEEV